MANKTKDVKNRPAGVNDNFEIAVMDINNIVENNKYVLKKYIQDCFKYQKEKFDISYKYKIKSLPGKEFYKKYKIDGNRAKKHRFYPDFAVKTSDFGVKLKYRHREGTQNHRSFFENC